MLVGVGEGWAAVLRNLLIKISFPFIGNDIPQTALCGGTVFPRPEPVCQQDFSTLEDDTVKLYIRFGSTYLCESALSKVIPTNNVPPPTNYFVRLYYQCVLFL